MKMQAFGRAAAALAVLSAAPAISGQPAPPGRAGESLEALSGAFEQISERVAPAVVQVFTSGVALGGDHAPALLTRQEGTASGVVIDPSGYVVTNAHVVSGARRIQVQLAERSEHPAARGAIRPQGVKLDAEVLGVDAITDLALLKVPGKDLKTLPLGDSDRLKQGQVVLAFGSPLGLRNTVTMGVVSAVVRQLSPDDPAVYVQTDAPVNPGNSGGPLVDATGQVVGINTLILSRSGGSEGVGLAIPSNVVRTVTDQLRAHGRVRRGMIGVQLQAIDEVFAKALGLPEPWGVIVADVDDDGPAGAAGVQVGDVILSLDGRPVEGVRQFSANLFRHAIDATATLELLRGADRLTLRVQVIERPDDPERYSALIDPKKNLVPQLDILGIDLPDEPAASGPRRRLDGGVLVAAVSPNASTADRFLLGDVIHAVNRTFVLTLDDLRDAVADLKDGDPVVVQVERQGQLMFVAFEVD
jgi:serine protease Do